MIFWLISVLLGLLFVEIKPRSQDGCVEKFKHPLKYIIFTS